MLAYLPESQRQSHRRGHGYDRLQVRYRGRQRGVHRHRDHRRGREEIQHRQLDDAEPGELHLRQRRKAGQTFEDLFPWHRRPCGDGAGGKRQTSGKEAAVTALQLRQKGKRLCRGGQRPAGGKERPLVVPRLRWQTLLRRVGPAFFGLPAYRPRRNGVQDLH